MFLSRHGNRKNRLILGEDSADTFGPIFGPDILFLPNMETQSIKDRSTKFQYWTQLKVSHNKSQKHAWLIMIGFN